MKTPLELIVPSPHRSHIQPWNGTFHFLRPRWQTLMQFLELCAEFDGSEHQILDVPTKRSSIWVDKLSPLFAFPGPNFSVATQTLNAYYARATRMQNRRRDQDEHRYTCTPWADDSYHDGTYARHSTSIGRSSPWIALVTLSTPNLHNKSAVALSLNDKQEYCDRHGYDFHTITQTVPGRDAAWAKLPGILALLHRYDWVVCLDLDTVIYDHDVRMEEFLDPDHDVILGLDYNGINSGVLFLRNSTWSRALLAEAWTLTNEPMSHIWWEQSALMRLFKNEGVRNHVKYCPQMYFNSYISFDKSVEMEENGGRGPFIVHFAGVSEKWDILPRFHAQRRNIKKGA